VCMCVCVYIHTHYVQYRDAGQAKEIKKIRTAVNAACQFCQP
jgi:hypothetical protein